MLAEAGEGQHDLVIAVPGELWGVNPDTGKLRWFVEGPRFAKRLFVARHCRRRRLHDRRARRRDRSPYGAGGKGDVRESHVLWATGVTAASARPYGRRSDLRAAAAR